MMAESHISRIPTEVLAEILLELSSDGETDKLGMESENYHPRRLKQPLTSAVAVNRQWNQVIVTEPRSYSIVLCFRCDAGYVYSDSPNSLPSSQEYAEWLEKSDGCDIQVDILFNTYMNRLGPVRDLIVPYAGQLSAFYFQFERAWLHHPELIEILSSLASFPRLRSLCFRWMPDRRIEKPATVFNLASITLDAPVLEKLSLANATLNWRSTSQYSPLNRLSRLKVEMNVNDPSETLTWSSLLDVLHRSPQFLHLDLNLDRIHGPYQTKHPKIHLSHLRSCTLAAHLHDLLRLLSLLELDSLKAIALNLLPNAIDVPLPSNLENLNPDLPMMQYVKLTGFDAPSIGWLLSRCKTDKLQHVTHTFINPLREDTLIAPPPPSFPIVSTFVPNLNIDMRGTYNWDGEHRNHNVKQISDVMMTCREMLSLIVQLPPSRMSSRLEWKEGSSAATPIIADNQHKLLTLRKIMFHSCFSTDSNYLVSVILSMLEAPQLSALVFDETDYSSKGHIRPPPKNLFRTLTHPLVQIQSLSLKMNQAAIVLPGVPVTFPNLQELHVHHIEDQPDWRWDSILPHSHVIPLPRLEVMTVIPMEEADGESFYKLWIFRGLPLRKLGVGSLEVIERWWTSEVSVNSV